MRSIPVVLAFFLLSTASAIAMPADCSKAPVPAGPAKGEVQGTPFVPSVAELASVGSMTQDGVSFTTFRITIKKPEGDFEAEKADVDFLVPKGKQPDGRSFHKVPGSISKQPMAADGLPEIQGWSYRDDATHLRVSSVFVDKDTLQLNFGKRAGGKIAGTIYLCAPGDKPLWVGGHFDAAVK